MRGKGEKKVQKRSQNKTELNKLESSGIGNTVPRKSLSIQSLQGAALPQARKSKAEKRWKWFVQGEIS